MDSFMGWVGGKKLLRKAIFERFPGCLSGQNESPARTEKISKYVEVFGGAGWVLFYQDKHAETEVYNDINSQLVNLFRCVKFHPEAIIQEMDYLLNSREIFNCLKNLDLLGLTDIQKAARYLYLIRASYGAKLSTFGARARHISHLDEFKDIQKRLERVVIENKSYDALIRQYDGKETLFYCDPPYYGAEQFYNTGSFVLDEEQHIALRDLLVGIKGKVILSYNDCSFIRGIYSGMHVESISRQNNLASRHGAGKDYQELIIKNF